MNMLFDEVALFDEGKKRHRHFDLPGTDLQLWEQFFPKFQADHYFQLLRDATPWQQRTRKMYDKTVLDPRLTAWYGGGEGLEWTPLLQTIRSHVEQQCDISFNRVLLNYYRDGNDSVAWHSDTLPSGGRHHPIASITLGDTRIFKVRSKPGQSDSTVEARRPLQLDIPLTHGSFLLMDPGMQEHYEHHIPKTSKPVGPRINLTFRISDSEKSLFYRNTP